MMMEKIKLLDDVRWLASELSKTGVGGKRSKNPRVIEAAISEVARRYGADMGEVARDYLNATK